MLNCNYGTKKTRKKNRDKIPLDYFVS